MKDKALQRNCVTVIGRGKCANSKMEYGGRKDGEETENKDWHKNKTS